MLWGMIREEKVRESEGLKINKTSKTLCKSRIYTMEVYTVKVYTVKCKVSYAEICYVLILCILFHLASE